MVSIVIATVGGLTGLACAVAADRLWRGQAPGIGDIVSAVRRSIPRAVPIWLLVIGLQVAFTLVAERFMPTTPGGRIPGTLDEQAAGLLAVVPIVLIGAIVLVFFQVPAVADPAGDRARGRPRSRHPHPDVLHPRLRLPFVPRGPHPPAPGSAG